MKAVGIIPARWGSTRFPGKPLALILGKPLLQWVIEGSQTSQSLSEIVVATDDLRIADLTKSLGVRSIMTDSDLPTGTDRIWQAAREIDADVILNIQGDEPLIEGAILDQLVAPFQADSGASLQMATLGRKLDQESLHSPNTAKIVVNARDEALYFSRFPIPHSRSILPLDELTLSSSLKHIGIYAYRREFLEVFCAQKPTLIEQCESLEQLRALYLGARIRVIRVEHEGWGVDVPSDVQKIEVMILQRSASSSSDSVTTMPVKKSEKVLR